MEREESVKSSIPEAIAIIEQVKQPGKGAGSNRIGAAKCHILHNALTEILLDADSTDAVRALLAKYHASRENAHMKHLRDPLFGVPADADPAPIKQAVATVLAHALGRGRMPGISSNHYLSEQQLKVIGNLLANEPLLVSPSPSSSPPSKQQNGEHEVTSLAASETEADDDDDDDDAGPDDGTFIPRRLLRQSPDEFDLTAGGGSSGQQVQFSLVARPLNPAYFDEQQESQIVVLYGASAVVAARRIVICVAHPCMLAMLKKQKDDTKSSTSASSLSSAHSSSDVLSQYSMNTAVDTFSGSGSRIVGGSIAVLMSPNEVAQWSTVPQQAGAASSSCSPFRVKRHRLPRNNFSLVVKEENTHAPSPPASPTASSPRTWNGFVLQHVGQDELTSIDLTLVLKCLRGFTNRSDAPEGVRLAEIDDAGARSLLGATARDVVSLENWESRRTESLASFFCCPASPSVVAERGTFSAVGGMLCTSSSSDDDDDAAADGGDVEQLAERRNALNIREQDDEDDEEEDDQPAGDDDDVAQDIREGFPLQLYSRSELELLSAVQVLLPCSGGGRYKTDMDEYDDEEQDADDSDGEGQQSFLPAINVTYRVGAVTRTVTVAPRHALIDGGWLPPRNGKFVRIGDVLISETIPVVSPFVVEQPAVASRVSWTYPQLFGFVVANSGSSGSIPSSGELVLTPALESEGFSYWMAIARSSCGSQVVCLANIRVAISTFLCALDDYTLDGSWRALLGIPGLVPLPRNMIPSSPKRINAAAAAKSDGESPAAAAAAAPAPKRARAAGKKPPAKTTRTAAAAAAAAAPAAPKRARRAAPKKSASAAAAAAAASSLSSKKKAPPVASSRTFTESSPLAGAAAKLLAPSGNSNSSAGSSAATPAGFEAFLVILTTPKPLSRAQFKKQLAHISNQQLRAFAECLDQSKAQSPQGTELIVNFLFDYLGRWEAHDPQAADPTWAKSKRLRGPLVQIVQRLCGMDHHDRMIGVKAHASEFVLDEAAWLSGRLPAESSFVPVVDGACWLTPPRRKGGRFEDHLNLYRAYDALATPVIPRGLPGAASGSSEQQQQQQMLPLIVKFLPARRKKDGVWLQYQYSEVPLPLHKMPFFSPKCKYPAASLIAELGPSGRLSGRLKKTHVVAHSPICCELLGADHLSKKKLVRSHPCFAAHHMSFNSIKINNLQKMMRVAIEDAVTAGSFEEVFAEKPVGFESMTAKVNNGIAGAGALSIADRRALVGALPEGYSVAEFDALMKSHYLWPYEEI